MFSTTSMVSIEMEDTPAAATTSPRISFSADFLNDFNFITINPSESIRNPDHFEFFPGDESSHPTISTAEELFFEGKLLPFWHNRETEKQGKIIGAEEKDVIVAAKKENEEDVKKKVELESGMNWSVDDDDPSPRPPKCTVLWKELLRLKKQRAPSYLSPSSSSSSSSSGSFGGCELGEKEKEKEKKGLERSRSGTLRIRPMVNVPICTHGKPKTLPPLFPQGGRRHKY